MPEPEHGPMARLSLMASGLAARLAGAMTAAALVWLMIAWSLR